MFQEIICLKGNGAADVDQVAVRLFQAFLGHELLFIELLSGAQAGVLDLDIDVRLEARKPDQVSGQGVDLDRASHVEDENLTAMGIGTREHHEADRLGNGHEIADDIRVGHGDRTALFDLLFEDRDDRAVAAQHVAETDGDKFRLYIFEDPSSAVLISIFLAVMGEELGDLGGFSLLDLVVKALDDHLAQALAGTHDVSGIDGLVGGDQDKALAAVDHGRIGGLVSADGVVFDRLTGAVLHQRDMLMGGGVVDDLRVVVLKEFKHPPAVADRPDQDLQIEIRIFLAQFKLDLISVVFVDIKNDELSGVVGCDLAAELTADGSAATGDEDSFSIYKGKDLFHVRLHRLTSQKILDRDVLHGGDFDLAQDQLVHAGKVFEFTTGLLTDGQDVAALGGGGTGDRDIDLVHTVSLDRFHDRVAASDDRDSVNKTSPLVGAVVDDTDDLLPDLLRFLDVPQDHVPRVTGSDQHDPVPGCLAGIFVPVGHQQYEPVGEPHSYDQDELQDRAEEVVGHRHAAVHHRDPHSMDDERDD